jgi:hypothetical protein
MKRPSTIPLVLLATTLFLPALVLAKPAQTRLVAPPGPVTDPIRCQTLNEKAN